MIRNKAQVQEYLLNKLIKSEAGILDAALVSGDGFVIVSTNQEQEFREKLAAHTALVFRPALKIAGDLDMEGVNFVLISGKKKNIFLSEISEGQILAINVASGADWEKVQNLLLKTTGDLRYIAHMEGNIADNLDSEK